MERDPATGLTACTHCGCVQSVQRPRCHFCRFALRKSAQSSTQASWSYLLTALLFYVPANVLPIMSTTQLGRTTYATIGSGVILLWEHGSYLVASIIFIASIVVPLAKFIALFALCAGGLYGRLLSPRGKAQVYRFTEFIGRWSMVDVFVVGFLAALIQMGTLMAVYPGPGALAFAAMVIFTMLAANSIDPQRFWSGRAGHG